MPSSSPAGAGPFDSVNDAPLPTALPTGRAFPESSATRVSNANVGGNALKLLLFFLVCTFSLCFFYAQGTCDVPIWLKWMANAEQFGVVGGYTENHADYPPLCAVILAVVSRLCAWLDMMPFTGLKATLVFFLWLTSAIVFLITGNLVLASVAQLALIVSSVGLVYMDIFVAPTLLLALWALRTKRLFLGSLLFTTTCLIKWQPLIIAPFVLLYILMIRVGDEESAVGNGALERPLRVREFVLSAVLPCLLVSGLVLGVFRTAVTDSFVCACRHEALSACALNFGYIVSYCLNAFLPEEFGPLLGGGKADIILTDDPRVVLGPRLLFVVSYGLALLSYCRTDRSFRSFVRCALVGYLAYFTFNIGVHENHLFVPGLLAIVLYWADRSALPTSLAVILAANINLLFFFGQDLGFGPNMGLYLTKVVLIDLGLVFSILYVLLFLVLLHSIVGARTEEANPEPHG